MRRHWAFGLLATLVICAWHYSTPLLAHDPPPKPTSTTHTIARRTADGPTCRLKLSLVDHETGQPLPGVVQILDHEDHLVELPILVSRGQGIEQIGPIHNWWVLAEPTVLTVPAEEISLNAFSGLETERAHQHLDLTGKTEASLEICLVRFARQTERGQLAGNTHLHLMKLSRDEADRYLREVPLADGLEIVFLSYLERAQADLEYTSNKYTREDLDRLEHGRLRWGTGEEHRHNFGPQGEGYGHLLLLDIPHVIRPVSIGPGITKQGTDAPPLQAGINEARRTGGKVIWAHNIFGYEDIPNWVTGRVDANNIFDGSARGSYKDTYYRYLNVGLHVPFSTGTDWFIYDFSRVYVATDRSLTPTQWLARLAAGNSFITNGPLLEFFVDYSSAGGTIDLKQPGTVEAQGSAVGRHDFKRIELIANGRVIDSAPAKREGDHYVATLNATPTIDEPTWLALRTPPPPVKDDPELQEPVGQNEYGGNLFAHTSPIYVTLQGQGVFDSATAQGLIVEMNSDWQKIEQQAKFANAVERERVERVYREGIEVLEQKLRERSR